jgi:hypothetical protein
MHAYGGTIRQCHDKLPIVLPRLGRMLYSLQSSTSIIFGQIRSLQARERNARVEMLLGRAVLSAPSQTDARSVQGRMRA